VSALGCRGIGRRELELVLVEIITEQVSKFVNLSFVALVAVSRLVHILPEKVFEGASFIGACRVEHPQAVVIGPEQAIRRICQRHGQNEQTS
jgi:hypothetical protein